MLGKKWDSIESKFPSIAHLSKSESDLEKWNMFPEDYDEYNATKKLI
jgi:hypothetical protein